jgi:hypothetical protein
VHCRRSPNELAVWSLCGDGWKQILKARLDKLQEQRNKKLNTPKTNKIDELSLQSYGLTWPNPNGHLEEHGKITQL